MLKKETNIFERISLLADKRGFKSINDFALNGLGYKSSEKINRLKDPTKKPSFEIVRDISNKFEDINVRWLVTGIEEIPNNYNKVSEPTKVFRLKTDTNLDIQTIPLYSAESVAGITPIFADLSCQEPIDYIHIPNAPKCDGALYNIGDSMYPLLKSGDILAYKIIKDMPADIYWGQKYILYLDIDGDNYMTTKFIKKGKDDDHILLVSANKHHEDKEVHLSKVKALANIKISIRLD
jgi:phage repressor protein C with HTH and peptisase S24 domain